MTVGFEHPVVADYLRRLGAAATSLPSGRREELVAEIRGHVAEALTAAGRGDEATVRSVLDRLGDPDDIVAAELESDGAVSVGRPYAAPFGSTAQPLPAGPPSPWGALEVVAVLGLTIGIVILPVVGPIVGIVCAWMSDRWTKREKVVATLWTAAAPLVVVLLGLALFTARASNSSGDSVPAPVVQVSAPAVSSS